MLASRLAIAEKFIRKGNSLYRHYCISEVQSNVKQFTGVGITDAEAVEIVQKIRDEYGIGPIADYNMPGYIEEE